MSTRNPKFSRVLVTNIPGSAWDGSPDNSFAKNLARRAEKEYGFETSFWAIRDAVIKIAEEENVHFIKEKAHVAPTDLKRVLRRAAFERTTRQLKDAHESFCVIESRAIYYSPEGLDEPSLTDGEIKLLQPDIVLTVIDDPLAIRNRLPTHRDTAKYRGLSITDLVRWLELEVERAKTLASAIGRPFYIVPRQQVGAALEILFTEKEPVYASYPMSNLPENEKAAVSKFVEHLRRFFIVFDPACMGTAHADNQGWSSAELQAYRRNVIKRDIEWFIQNNSKRVIVYAPKNVQMAGSQSELDNAFHQGKENWVVVEPQLTDWRGKLTPFLDQNAALVFVSSEEFIEFLALTPAERDTYAQIVSAMWDFKRTGRLAGLREKAVKGASLPEADEKEVYREFLEACESLIALEGGPKREGLAKLCNRCWKHNRVLFRESPQAAQLPLEIGTSTEGMPRQASADVLGEVAARKIRSALRQFCREKKVKLDEAFYLEDRIQVVATSGAAARTNQLEEFFEEALSQYRAKKTKRG